MRLVRDGDSSAKENIRGVRGKQETVMYENPGKGKRHSKETLSV